MLFILYLFLAGIPRVENIDAVDLVTKMNTAVNSYSSLAYKFHMEERWFGNMKLAESNIKVMFKPYKVYMNFIISTSPAKEVLYNPVLYGDNAFINIGKIIPNIRMSPYSSKMRHQQHYTIMYVGFHKIIEILNSVKDKLGNDFEKNSKIEDHLIIHNTNVYRFTLEDPSFCYEKYIVKKGESSSSIALKNNICEYLIIEKNNLKNYNQVKENMTILIPKSYCKKCIIYIDKQTWLPIQQEIYDDKGLLEKYVYTNIKLDKNYSDKDFSKDTEGFGF